MYAFTMMALLGLAILVVAKIGNHYLKQIAGAWAFMLVALGVGAAWLINLNLFGIWSIPVRNSDIGGDPDQDHPGRRRLLLAGDPRHVRRAVPQVHR
jgi:hypothetical protein